MSADDTDLQNAGDGVTGTKPKYVNDQNEQQCSRSALQDNIAKKGKNAYYFAHANTARGPEWDGKAEPRLLSRQSITDCDDVDAGRNGHLKSSQFRSSTSFDYHKSNITAYSFLDDGPVIKIYLTGLEGIGEKCTDDDIDMNYTERSFSITINNYCNPTDAMNQSTSSTPQVLSFSRLCGNISNAKFVIKKDKVIVTLTKHEKDNNKTWHTIHDKGKPDH